MTRIFCGSRAWAALTTCAIIGEPPSSCSTFARFDFILVPRPAAMTKTFSGLGDVVLAVIRSYSHCYGSQCLLSAVEYNVGEAIRVVPDFFAIVQQVSTYDLSPLIERIVNRIAESDLISAFGRVAFGLLAADPAIVDDHKVEVNFGRVLLD